MIGAGDEAKLTDPWQNLSANFGVPLVSPPADVLVNDDEAYKAAGFEFASGPFRDIPPVTSFICGREQSRRWCSWAT